MTRTKKLCIILISLNCFHIAKAQLNSHKLGQMYNRSACGLNYAVDSWIVTDRAAYLGNPGLGLPATFNFTKLPTIPCYKIDTAFLWWTVSYRNLECFYDLDTAKKYCTNTFQEFDDDFNYTYCGTPKNPQSSINVTNPDNITTNYTPTLVGEDKSKLWHEKGTRTYRANVTSAITGNGIYSIDIAKDSGDIEREYETDGFMLMVVYRDLSSSYKGTLIINDGTFTRSDADNTCGLPSTDSITGFSACDNSIAADAFLLVSDLQKSHQKTFQATLNGKTVTDSCMFFNFTRTATAVTQGQSIAQFGIDSIGGDCYALAVTGLYYQTTSCETCLPLGTSTSLTISKSSTPSMCEANTGTATVSPSGGVRPYRYSWSPSGGNDSIAKNLTPGTYIVTVSDNACKSKTDSVTVTTAVGFTLPHPTQTNVTCFGDSNGTATAVPTGGKTPYIYSWTANPIQTTATATGLKAGKYTITVKDGDGCQLKDSVTITHPNNLILTSKADSSICIQPTGKAIIKVVSGGTPPYSYSWSTTPIQITDTAKNLLAGTYTVTITYSSVCHKDTVVTVPLTGGFKMTSSKTDVSCYGGNDGMAKVSLNGGTKPYSFLWLPNISADSIAKNLKAGTDTVTAIDANQCKIKSIITINQPTALVITPGSDTTICVGKSATIRAIANGGISSYNYLWSNAITTSAQTVSPDSTTSYVVTVTDSNKCKTTDTLTVTVTQPPMVNVSSSGAIDLCTNDSTGLTASAPGATTYLWSTGDTTSSINVRPETTTTYTVTAATDNCQSVQISYVVTVTKTKVVSQFTPDPIKGPAPLTVNFTNNSTNGSSYVWTFGDNSVDSYLTNPSSHFYDPAGKYTIQLIAKNGNCSDTISKTIEAIPVSSLVMPNVFTPNDDGKNDRFLPIIYKGILQANIKIYNRWGNEVHSGDLLKGWDGLNCEDGTYYYVVRATGEDGVSFDQNGFVSLISKK